LTLKYVALFCMTSFSIFPETLIILFKDSWSYTSTQYIFMAWCLIKQWINFLGVVLNDAMETFSWRGT